VSLLNITLGAALALPGIYVTFSGTRGFSRLEKEGGSETLLAPVGTEGKRETPIIGDTRGASLSWVFTLSTSLG